MGEGELLAELLATVRELAVQARGPGGAEVLHSTAGRSAARQALVRLAAGPVSAEGLRTAAELAGLDPDGGFQGWLLDGSDVRQAQEQLDRVPGRSAVGAGAGMLLILTQEADEQHVRAALGAERSLAAGLLRIGPYAASETLLDARAVAALAGGRSGLWRYQDLWPLTGAAATDRLEPLLVPAVAVARTFPHLADAVRAFADHGFTVGSAAGVLRVPVDTAGRWLDRWQQLTGTDLRTLAGLTASRTAVELAARAR